MSKRIASLDNLQHHTAAWPFSAPLLRPVFSHPFGVFCIVELDGHMLLYLSTDGVLRFNRKVKMRQDSGQGRDAVSWHRSFIGLLKSPTPCMCLDVFFKIITFLLMSVDVLPRRILLGCMRMC